MITIVTAVSTAVLAFILPWKTTATTTSSSKHSHIRGRFQGNQGNTLAVDVEPVKSNMFDISTIYQGIMPHPPAR